MNSTALPASHNFGWHFFSHSRCETHVTAHSKGQADLKSAPWDRHSSDPLRNKLHGCF